MVPSLEQLAEVTETWLPGAGTDLRRAVDYAETDPAASLNKCRTVLERAVESIYVERLGALPSRHNLDALLKNTQFRNLINTNNNAMLGRMEFVRGRGNAGSHGRGTLKPYEAYECLEMLARVLVWAIEWREGLQLAAPTRDEMQGMASGSVLERLSRPGSSAHRRVSEPRVADINNLEGRTLFGFELQQVLGEGTTSVVYQGREAGGLQAMRALKVIRPLVLADETDGPRILREARICEVLTHPNIVRFFEVREDQGLVALVLELLAGETLEQRLTRGAVPTEEALALAADVCDGLAHAHARGIRHRDLKPGNVFIGSDGRARLLDFGLATNAALADRVSSSLPGHRVFIPRYTAPEVLMGGPVTPAAEVYALGSIVWEMIAGQHPMTETGAEISYAGVIRFHQHQEIPRLGSVAPPVAEALDNLLWQATRKEPERRPQGAAALRERLRAVAGSIRRATERVTLHMPQAAPSMRPQPAAPPGRPMPPPLPMDVERVSTAGEKEASSDPSPPPPLPAAPSSSTAAERSAGLVASGEDAVSFPPGRTAVFAPQVGDGGNSTPVLSPEVGAVDTGEGRNVRWWMGGGLLAAAVLVTALVSGGRSDDATNTASAAGASATSALRGTQADSGGSVDATDRPNLENSWITETWWVGRSWTVQVASNRDRDEAVEKLRTFSRKMPDVGVMLFKVGGLYRLTAGRFSSRADAERRLGIYRRVLGEGALPRNMSDVCTRPRRYVGDSVSHVDCD